MFKGRQKKKKKKNLQTHLVKEQHEVQRDVNKAFCRALC